MEIWIGLGLGLVIGILVGLLGGVLALQSRLRAGQAQNQALNVQGIRTEAEARLHESQLATTAALAQAESLRGELAQAKKELSTLQQDHDVLQRQLATLKPMMAQVNTEKEQLLMNVAELRAENDRLRNTAASND